MTVVLLTGLGVAHRYVTSRFVEELGSDLSAVLISDRPVPPFRQRWKGYRRRYNRRQILSRVAARAYRSARRLDARSAATHEAILKPQPIDPGVYTTVDGHNGAQCLAELDRIRPDVIAVYGTGIIREPVCALARCGVLNMHTGLSPRYRGSDTIFWPIHNEEPEWIGVTIHLLSQGIDAGPILGTARPQIRADDTEDSLFAKSVIVGTELFLEHVREVAAGRVKGTPQELEDGREYRFVHRTVRAERRVSRLIDQGILRRYAEAEKG